MKQVILTVQITASVPDNADLEAIHLDNKREDFCVVNAGSLEAAEKCIQESYPDRKEVGICTWRSGNKWVTIHVQELNSLDA